jgi:hypothetical protein
VYGTTNLRVVDVGIIPIHLATHTHGLKSIFASLLDANRYPATAYVIAEKGGHYKSPRHRLVADFFLQRRTLLVVVSETDASLLYAPRET